MLLTRLDLVKDFIDYLVSEYDQAVLDYLTEYQEYSLEEAYDSYEWRDRRDYVTRGEDSCCGSWVVEDAVQYYPKDCEFNEEFHINYGAEQIVFIFDDVVYKISTSSPADTIDHLLEYLDEKFHPLFPTYDYVETYKDCEIYTQERVFEHMGYEYYISKAKISGIKYSVENDYVFRSTDCSAAIAMEYGTDFLTELCNEMSDAGYPYDIHGSNWGFSKEGKVRIFDPIFYEEF